MGCCLATGAAAGTMASGYRCRANEPSGIHQVNDAFEIAWSNAFRYAAEHSPFYREAFRGAGSVIPLEEIPPLDKGTLSIRNQDFLCVPRERVVEIVTTSGTLGSPLVWMLSESDLQRLALNEQKSFQCAGLTLRDTVLVAVAMDRCFIAGLAYSMGLRNLGCAAAPVGPCLTDACAGNDRAGAADCHCGSCRHFSESLQTKPRRNILT